MSKLAYEEMKTVVKPVLCPSCKTRNTFERKPKGDWVSADSGKVLWEAWICRVCGYKALKQKEV